MLAMKRRRTDSDSTSSSIGSSSLSSESDIQIVERNDMKTTNLLSDAPALSDNTTQHSNQYHPEKKNHGTNKFMKALYSRVPGRDDYFSCNLCVAEGNVPIEVREGLKLHLFAMKHSRTMHWQSDDHKRAVDAFPTRKSKKKVLANEFNEMKNSASSTSVRHLEGCRLSRHVIQSKPVLIHL